MNTANSRTARLATVATPQAQLRSFIDKYTPDLAREGRAAIASLRRSIPGAIELVYDNYNGLVIGFGPTERPSDAVVSLLFSSTHFALCFLQRGAALLPDPTGLLRGSGKQVRHVRIHSAKELDAPAVRALLAAAVSRSPVPIDRARRRRLIIRSISRKQRPRRPY